MSTSCHHGPSGQRMAGERHEGECEDCEECAERHCWCGRGHLAVSQRQTCTRCIVKARDRLAIILTLWIDLPAQAASHAQDGRPENDRMLGGEAMALLGNVADLRAWNNRIAIAEEAHLIDEEKNPYPKHVYDNPDIDGNPADGGPLLFLASTEDDWRSVLEHSAASHRATIANTIEYLAEHLHTAAQWHPAFDEFTDGVRKQVAHLEAVLHAGDRTEKGDVPCLSCQSRLERQVESDGSRGDWECPRCRRVYTDNGYRNAVTAAWTALQAELIDGVLWATPSRCAAEVGRSKRTIETWVRAGHVARACLISGRRQVVSVADATRENEARQRRNGDKCA